MVVLPTVTPQLKTCKGNQITLIETTQNKIKKTFIYKKIILACTVHLHAS